MSINERTCPNCGHPTMSWDVHCPGCEKIPWQTRAGRRAFRRQRRFPWKGLWVFLFLIALLSLLVYSKQLFQRYRPFDHPYQSHR